MKFKEHVASALVTAVVTLLVVSLFLAAAFATLDRLGTHWIL
jgi:hypothetical protein